MRVRVGLKIGLGVGVVAGVRHRVLGVPAETAKPNCGERLWG